MRQLPLDSLVVHDHTKEDEHAQIPTLTEVLVGVVKHGGIMSAHLRSRRRPARLKASGLIGLAAVFALLAADDPDELGRASRAADDLLAMALELGGTVSGEHGLGLVRSGWLARQWGERAVSLHGEIKRVFDPKGLLNPGKKVA